MKEKEPQFPRLQSLAFGKSDSGSCPDDELFAAFIDGALDEKEAAPIRSHLAECALCHSAMIAVTEKSGDPGPSVPDHLIAAVKKLVGKSSESVELQPHSVGQVVLKLFENTIELLKWPGFNIPGSEPAAVPIRSDINTDPSARRGEIIELTSSIPLIDGISLQKLGTEEMRITVQPRVDEARLPGKAYRVDLYACRWKSLNMELMKKKGVPLLVNLPEEESLIQSWPLEEEPLSLEPVTLGCYTLQVVMLDTGSGDPATILGSIDIELKK